MLSTGIDERGHPLNGARGGDGFQIDEGAFDLSPATLDTISGSKRGVTGSCGSAFSASQRSRSDMLELQLFFANRTDLAPDRTRPIHAPGMFLSCTHCCSTAEVMEPSGEVSPKSGSLASRPHTLYLDKPCD